MTSAEHGPIQSVVVASTGGRNMVSTEYRLGPLARDGTWPVHVVSAHPRPDAGQLAELLTAATPGSALILQRVLPRGKEMERLRLAYDRIVFDFDDAIYASPPELLSPRRTQLLKGAARLAIRGSPTASRRRGWLATTLRHVDVCVAGNGILAHFARRYANRVVEIPTTVEPIQRPPERKHDRPVVVWIGLPDNQQYLQLVSEPLERLTRLVDFELRIISAKPWAEAPIPAEFVPWSKEAERGALVTSTVGIAPLTDGPWTRGKCAMRAIQYGAHALPAVASPVGITDRVVLDGETGLLPRSKDDWLRGLQFLLQDPTRAAEMGDRALDHIKRHYSNEVALGLWRRVLA